MSNIYWSEFAILFVLSLIGDLAVMPYISQLIKSTVERTGKPLKLPMPQVLMLSFVQTAVLLGIAVGVGLLAAHAIGLGAPYIEAALAGSTASNAAPNGTTLDISAMLPIALFWGVVSGLGLLLVDLLFLPYLPEQLLGMARKVTQWQNFTASFYGGIAEEILMRLFGMSVLAWLLSRIWHTASGLPTDAVFWIANIVMCILFGLGHLPAAKGLLGHISPLMFARTMLLNGTVGFIFGWMFWKYGLEAAIIGHFVADIVFHCGGTAILHLNDRYHFIKTQSASQTPVTVS